jgi:dihydroorotate dehydrogenase electron transfer subunit
VDVSLTIVRPGEVEFTVARREKDWRALDKVSLVTRVERIASEYIVVEVECGSELANSRPGQFLMIRPVTERYLIRRPFTVFDADPQRNVVSIVFRVTGIGTAALARLRARDRVSMLGPLGNGFEIGPETKKAVIFARGAGMASLYNLALRCLSHRVQTLILLSARRPDLWLAEHELRSAGATVVAVDDESGSSDIARVREVVEPWYAETCQAFVCGSARLLQLAVVLGNRYGRSVQAALEAPMACGIGTCHACPVGRLTDTEGELVCVDGPIFGARLRVPELVSL